MLLDRTVEIEELLNHGEGHGQSVDFGVHG